MYQTLISAAQVQSLGTGNCCIVDCRFNLSDPQWGEVAFAQAHLPGARYVHLDRDLAAPVTPASGRHPLPSPAEFAARVGGWGIGPQTQVVVYDQNSGVYAARLWWMLRWIGHRNVAVLDGGLAAWSAAGLPLSADAPVVPTAEIRSVQAPAARAITVTTLQQRLAHDDIVLVDARAADRFAGQNEPLDAPGGHVPGAVNHPFARNLDERGQFLPVPALRERWLATLNGRDAGALVAMCGSGVSACHNLLALAHAGFADGQLYVGSWSEWIRDPARPVATGGAPASRDAQQAPRS